MTDALTNEGLAGICDSNFELAHYAINLARYYIHSGKEVTLREILNEVKKHPNPRYLEDLKSIDEIERIAEERQAFNE